MNSHFFKWVLLLFHVVTAILAIRCWSKSKSFAWRIFILMWIIYVFVLAAGEIILFLNKIQIYYLVVNFFSVLFYPCVLAVYTDVFKKKWLKRLVLLCAFSLAIWSIYLTLSNTKATLNWFYIIIASIVIVFFALAHLFKLLFENDSIESFSKDYYLWFSIGFIIYFSTSTVMCCIPRAQPMQFRSFSVIIYFFISYLLNISLWIGFKSAVKWIK